MTAAARDPELVAGAASDQLRAVLLGSPIGGRVLAAFPRAVYLELDRPPGDRAPAVVSLVTSDGTVHPNSIVLADHRPEPLHRCRPGQRVTFGGGRVIVGTHLDGAAPAGDGPCAVALRVTRWWASRPAVPPATTAALRAGCRRLATSPALVDSARAGFDVTALAHRNLAVQLDDLAVQLDDPAVLRAASRALVDALVRGDAPGAERVGLQLIGRGPGLTPSGDDVLCGLFTTVALLRPHRFAADVAGRLAVHARERTTSISAALVWYAARGCATGELAGAIRALAGADRVSSSAVDAALARLLAVGSTSGRDLAIGVHAGLAYMLGCAASGPGTPGGPPAVRDATITSHADTGTGARRR